MNLPFELDPDEKVIFEGDVTYASEAWKGIPGFGIGTTDRFFFIGAKNGPIEVRKGAIRSSSEGKHRLARRWSLTTQEGATHHFYAANFDGLRTAMNVLKGELPVDVASATQPPISNVRNKTAWLAAFSPFIAGLIVGFVLVAAGVDFEEGLSIQTAIPFGLGQLALIYIFLKIDHLSLQAQGYRVYQLGVRDPSNLFSYLFSRAKAFGHKPWYAWLWCVLFAAQALELLTSL